MQARQGLALELLDNFGVLGKVVVHTHHVPCRLGLNVLRSARILEGVVSVLRRAI